MANERDHYAILGIGRTASAAEVERAYKRAARETHPDVHPDEPSAAERFTAVTIAYETLGNPARRASYDRSRSAAHPAAAEQVPPARHVYLGRADRQQHWPGVARPPRGRPYAADAQHELFELALASLRARLFGHVAIRLRR